MEHSTRSEATVAQLLTKFSSFFETRTLN